LHRITNRRTFMEKAYAYTRARQPTAQLIAELCTATAQMLSDDLEGKVTMGLPGRICVVRQPREPK
jgi:hypothetical protein